MEITEKVFSHPGSYVNHPAMRAYVERVHRAGRRWGMMPSTPARANKFVRCARSRFSGDVPSSRASEQMVKGRAPRSARACGGDLDVAREPKLADNNKKCRDGARGASFDALYQEQCWSALRSGRCGRRSIDGAPAVLTGNGSTRRCDRR